MHANCLLLHLRFRTWSEKISPSGGMDLPWTSGFDSHIVSLKQASMHLMISGCSEMKCEKSVMDMIGLWLEYWARRSFESFFSSTPLLMIFWLKLLCELLQQFSKFINLTVSSSISIL